MMFHRILAVLFALCVPSFAAEPDQADYFPMNPGDEHTMTVAMTNAKGQTEKMIAHRKIEAEAGKVSVEKNGKTYLRLRTWMDGGPLSVKHTRLIRKDDQGLHSVADERGNAAEQLEVPMPLKPGNSWKYEDNGMIHTASVIAIETVIVGERKFENCFHIRSETVGGTFREDFWEAPKVGTVKSEIAYSNGVRITLTFREFKPGK